MWFGPYKDPSEHNRYGNVSFSLYMKDVVDRFGKELYYIDRLHLQTHTTTRLLLTPYTYNHLRKVKLEREGSPVNHKRWRHAVSHDTNCNGYPLTHPHEVDIAIEVDGDDCSWLYEHCDVEANNHSLANNKTNGRDQKDVCFLYNTVQKQRCCRDYDEFRARKYLARNFPELKDR